MKLHAITQTPSPALGDCQLTYVERAPIDVGKALGQHAEYCRVLREAGCEVTTLDVNLAFPDGTFVEDTAVVLDEVAVLCWPGAVTRQGEVAGIAPEIAKYRRLERIAPPATLEGGDVLRLGRTLYVGRSRRTNDAGVAALRRLVAPYGYTVVAVPVTGALHLKTACTSPAPGLLLANPDWLDLTPFTGVEVIAVDPDEPFAADVLPLPPYTLMDAACPATIRRVERRGVAVRPFDISELTKAEAGLTCMSLVFEASAGEP